MNYCCYTVSGKKVALLPPISVQINVHEDAPADDMTVIFPLIEQVPKIATIRVWNGEKPIFSGIIDEQIMGVTKNGAMLKLIARSRAALLLDNEAMPQEYHYPSLTQLYERHVEPYGFCGFIGNGGTFDTKTVSYTHLDVYKRQSEGVYINKSIRRTLWNIQNRKTRQN